MESNTVYDKNELLISMPESKLILIFENGLTVMCAYRYKRAQRFMYTNRMPQHYEKNVHCHCSFVNCFDCRQAIIISAV